VGSTNIRDDSRQAYEGMRNRCGTKQDGTTPEEGPLELERDKLSLLSG
jgi:hypothetical protein